jgi:methylmalonyl-CoA/ethylmalonyl-CoA epimerase
MIEGLVDHVAVAVHDIRTAMELFVETLGGSFLFAGDNPVQGLRWAQFRYPHGGKIELVTPLSPDASVARFIRSRGEGVHHITFKVSDIASALDSFRARGVPLTGIAIEDADWKEAFIHPRDGHGVLIQLAWSRLSDEENARHHLEPHGREGHRHLSLNEVIAGP